MKIKICLITAGLLIVANEIMAQGNNLIGTWHLDINKALTVMDPKYKIGYDSLPVAIKERATSRMNGRVFVFSDNGDIQVNWKSQKESHISNGQWLINELQKELSITINGQTSEYDYEFMSDAVLIIRAKNKRGFFDNLYLIKAN